MGFKNPMILKILGVVDILIGILFWMAMIFKISYFNPILLLLSLFIVAKGIIFLISLDFASVVDVISGFLIIYSINYGLHSLITIIIVIFLVQKGIFSMFS